MARPERHSRQSEGPGAARAAELAARVAWSYLATLLSSMAAALVALVADQALAPLACPKSSGSALDDAAATCHLSWALTGALLGFLAVSAPVLRILKQDWWLWCGLASLLATLVLIGAVSEVWWWVGLGLIPAAAALASAPWSDQPKVLALHRTVLTLMTLATVGLLVWSYLPS